MLCFADTAWFGHLDIVVAAPGKIVPPSCDGAGKVKVVESSLPGIVRAIHVEDGDHVAEGDPLISLDPTESDADLEKLTREWLAAVLEVSREEALIGAVALASGGAPIPPEDLFEVPEGAPANEVAHSIAGLRAEWAALMGERQWAAVCLQLHALRQHRGHDRQPQRRRRRAAGREQCRRCGRRSHDWPAGGPADAVLHGADRDRAGTSECERTGRASGSGHVGDSGPADGRERRVLEYVLQPDRKSVV